MKNKDKDRISKLDEKKIENFLKFNQAYFEKDKPLVPDFEFDNLKQELLQLKKK